MQCPRCGDSALTPGEIHRCTRCDGSWISNATMATRVGEAQHRRKPKLDWQLDARDSLACAECAQKMEALRLFDVPVDRCRDHGIWLDAGELDKILTQSGVHAREGGLLHAIVDVFWMWN